MTRPLLTVARCPLPGSPSHDRPRQVNGKARGEIQLPKDADEATAKEIALANEKVKKFTEGKEIKKFIYVPGRIVNVVVGK